MKDRRKMRIVLMNENFGYVLVQEEIFVNFLKYNYEFKTIKLNL